MEYCKLQIGCMIIVLYVACIYIREKQIYQMKRKNVLFETILAAGIVGIFFDGATAYTVNHLAEIPASVNTFLHLCFLSFLDIFVFLMFLYMYEKRGTHRTFPASSDQYCGCDRIYATA